MNVLTLDVETTISNKGNPFDQTNKLVVAGFKFLGMKTWDVYLDEIGAVKRCQEFIDNADLLVGFNIKFDLHWLQRIGIDFSGKRIWDCQIGEFLLENQKNPYPSLNQACEKYGLLAKYDVVKNEYWEKGIDTDAISREILSDYLSQDLILTEQVYLKQVPQFEINGKGQLFKLQCMDLLTLQEMEWNGIKFNTKKARAKAAELEEELVQITEKLSVFTNGVPFNPNSNDDVSCLLYGGIITVDDRIPIGIYKTGAKVGHTRYKIIKKEYELPRLVEPIKGTETVKEGYWKTNSDVLRCLKLNKTAKTIVGLLNRYSELEKLAGTYLNGYSQLIEKMNWEYDTLHGTLNQCVVVTGRLSSSRPNLQNCDSTTKLFMESRYAI